MNLLLKKTNLIFIIFNRSTICVKILILFIIVLKILRPSIVHFLIPAAGSGSRMKAGKNKLLIDFEGESLIYWTLKSVFSASSINWVGIIGQPKDKNL